MGTSSPLRGRVGYWLRQFGDTAERDLDKILDTMRDYGGGDCLCMKVADGLRFQGANDPRYTPINSLTDIVRMRDRCNERGFAFLPVVVPRGLRGEAQFHGGIAREIGSLMTDIEPYDGFWDNAPREQIPWYTGELRGEAPDAYLINQPDPRERALQESRVVETAAHFDGIAAQHYVGWVTGGINWTDVDLEVRRYEQLTALGREMYVTLYGVDQIQLAAAFWERVRDRALGVNIFAFGPMNADQLRFFAALPRPEPEPKPVDYRARYIESLQAMLAAATDDMAQAEARRQWALERLAAEGVEP